MDVKRVCDVRETRITRE